MSILCILPSGLTLRRSSRLDASPLSEFNALIHSDTDEPDFRVAAWTQDLLSGNHPTFHEDDFTIIEDPATGKIVSALNLISQTWTYGGIPFKVGRPELVGTDPAYRNRGLVRYQFDVIHEWSRQRGELVQGITGIPYYYRQFGYEMALNLGGGRIGGTFTLPTLKKDSSEPFLIRPALETDLTFIAKLAEEGSRRSLINAQRDESMWRYELNGRRAENVNRVELRIITTTEGDPVGFIAHPPFLWDEMLALTVFELRSDLSWQSVTPSVIRYLWKTGEEFALAEAKTLKSYGFYLCDNHPAYQVANEFLPRLKRRYAWYLRVPDLPAFLRLITPALEERLANSPFTGHTGDLKLDFFRNGIILKFQMGHLTEIETWQPSTKNYGHAAFPGLTFLQLLFGYRSLDDLLFSFPDCFANQDAAPLLRVLFPKQPSEVWPIH